jgi:hypothetical protein
VPAGRYRVLDGEGRPVGIEGFRCASGPAGWRYVADIETSDPEPHRERVDLVVDTDWRPVRLVIETGSHALAVENRGDVLTGTLDGTPIEIAFGPEAHLDYLSPAFNAVTAQRLSASTEIDVVFLEPVTCEPIHERQRYELVHPRETVETPVGTFTADRWIYEQERTGWSRPLWVAGDVVVAYEDLFALEEFEPGPDGPFPR